MSVRTLRREALRLSLDITGSLPPKDRLEKLKRQTPQLFEHVSINGFKRMLSQVNILRMTRRIMFEEVGIDRRVNQRGGGEAKSYYVCRCHIGFPSVCNETFPVLSSCQRYTFVLHCPSGGTSCTDALVFPLTKFLTKQQQKSRSPCPTERDTATNY